jgi:hypothetical protein
MNKLHPGSNNHNREREYVPCSDQRIPHRPEIPSCQYRLVSDCSPGCRGFLRSICVKGSNLVAKICLQQVLDESSNTPGVESRTYEQDSVSHLITPPIPPGSRAGSHTMPPSA